MNESIKCKRPILDHDTDGKEGFAYYYGCHYYFPIESKSRGKREEAIIPQGTDFLRLRIKKNELEIKIKWRQNFNFARAILNNLGGKDGVIFFSTLAFLFNRTEIHVTSQFIRIEHKPIEHLLPMVFHNANYVKQFHVKKLERNFWQSRLVSYHGLYMRLANGKEELIMLGLKENTLLFIEQEIERVLGIVDH